MDERAPVLSCPAGCGPLDPVTVQIEGLDHGHHPEQGTTQVIVAILACPACGAGRYRCFEHDCTGYPASASYPIEGEWTLPMAPAEIERIRSGLEQCPDRMSGSCQCPAHRSLLDSQDALRRRGDGPKPVAAAIALVGELPRLRPVFA
jgi:hypothetical protein